MLSPWCRAVLVLVCVLAVSVVELEAKGGNKGSLVLGMGNLKLKRAKKPDFVSEKVKVKVFDMVWKKCQNTKQVRQFAKGTIWYGLCKYARGIIGQHMPRVKLPSVDLNSMIEKVTDGKGIPRDIAEWLTHLIATFPEDTLRELMNTLGNGAGATMFLGGNSGGVIPQGGGGFPNLDFLGGIHDDSHDNDHDDDGDDHDDEDHDSHDKDDGDDDDDHDDKDNDSHDTDDGDDKNDDIIGTMVHTGLGALSDIFGFGGLPPPASQPGFHDNDDSLLDGGGLSDGIPEDFVPMARGIPMARGMPQTRGLPAAPSPSHEEEKEEGVDDDKLMENVNPYARPMMVPMSSKGLPLAAVDDHHVDNDDNKVGVDENPFSGDMASFARRLPMMPMPQER